MGTLSEISPLNLQLWLWSNERFVSLTSVRMRQMIRIPDELKIEDGYGYRVTEEDLRFLNITLEDAIANQDRKYPLGMTQKRFDLFVEELQSALNRDSVFDADVRLQGSSAHFFSGHHKLMPAGPLEIAQLIRQSGRFPVAVEIEEIVEKIEQLWPASARPKRRPFDVTNKLRIDYQLSDYDVQISSDELVNRAVEFCESQGPVVRQLKWSNPQYDFISKDLYGRMCPTLQDWAVRQSMTLGRPVTLAIFGAEGPPEQSGPLSMLSSHFRQTDWKLVDPVGTFDVA